MSWLTKLFSKSSESNNSRYDQPDPYIPEDIFIEKSSSGTEGTPEVAEFEREKDNIHMVYSFLSKDFQQLGYDDALVHPETSYRNEKIREIQGDLDIVIRKAKTYYEDAIKGLNFLITSRTRLGMVDLVDELKMRKEKAEDHYTKVVELHKEAIDQGETHRLIISYNRGFQNGMAAIAIHESNKWKF